MYLFLRTKDPPQTDELHNDLKTNLKKKTVHNHIIVKGRRTERCYETYGLNQLKKKITFVCKLHLNSHVIACMCVKVL